MLLDLVREQFGLTAPVGLDNSSLRLAHCVDDKPVSACSMLRWMRDGCAIETVEGLSSRTSSIRFEEAFMEFGDVVQCGYCTSGFILTAKALLAECRSDGNKIPIT